MRDEVWRGWPWGNGGDGHWVWQWLPGWVEASSAESWGVVPGSLGVSGIDSERTRQKEEKQSD